MRTNERDKLVPMPDAGRAWGRHFRAGYEKGPASAPIPFYRQDVVVRLCRLTGFNAIHGNQIFDVGNVRRICRDASARLEVEVKAQANAQTAARS